MPNFVKQKTYFYTLFKNIPYTDSEWERDTQHRAHVQSGDYWIGYKAKYKPRTTRPNWSFKRGPSVRSLHEAQAICDKALAQGAQQVECGWWSDRGCEERWVRRKGGQWKQVKHKK